MVRLVMILLGVDYLRTRWRPLTTLGWISLVLGIVVFIDALDNALYFRSPLLPACFCWRGWPRWRWRGPAWAANGRCAT